MKLINVIIIEDNPADAFLIEGMLKSSDYWKFKIVNAITLKQGLEKIKNDNFEVIILDLGLPDGNGVSCVDAVLKVARSIPVIVLTGDSNEQVGIESVIRGAQDYLVKWIINSDQLMRSIRYSFHRKKIEEKLIESEDKLRTIIEASPDAVITSDFDGSINYASHRANEIFGSTESESLIGYSIKDYIAPSDQKKILIKFLNLEKKRTIKDVQILMKRKDGSQFFGEISSSVILNKLGKSDGVISIIKDVSERKRTEYAIKSYQQNLRSMASQLNLAEEKERRKIAVDLHDDLGQTLAMIRIKLSALKSENLSASVMEHLLEMEKYVTNAIKGSRTLTYELSPPVLYEFGLEAAINWKLEQISNEHNIIFNMEVTDKLPDFPEDLLILLFRGVSELLNNIIKHAFAKKISVTLNLDGKCLNILVEDDGKGFDETKLNKQDGEIPGIGLFSLKERLEYFDGTLTIDSNAKMGSKVYISLPVIN